MSIVASVDVNTINADQALRELKEAGENLPAKLLCIAELTYFDAGQRQELLPLLWRYILRHRDSPEHDTLIAVGAAIRKYVAIMPIERIGELAILLESGHRSSLPIELEIEVVKMIFRNFEVHPPVVEDIEPELAQRLWELAQAYVNPRVLLRDKFSAAASLAVEAIVAMRSSLAEPAWLAAVNSPYRWFAEIVTDDLERLHELWHARNHAAATWLANLRARVLDGTQRAQ